MRLIKMNALTILLTISKPQYSGLLKRARYRSCCVKSTGWLFFVALVMISCINLILLDLPKCRTFEWPKVIFLNVSSLTSSSSEEESSPDILVFEGEEPKGCEDEFPRVREDSSLIMAFRKRFNSLSTDRAWVARETMMSRTIVVSEGKV